MSQWSKIASLLLTLTLLTCACVEHQPPQQALPAKSPAPASSDSLADTDPARTPASAIDWEALGVSAADPPVPPEVQTSLPRTGLEVLGAFPVGELNAMEQAQARSLLKQHGFAVEPNKMNEAAFYGQTRLTVIMIKAGLNPNAVDNQSMTTVIAACAGGHLITAQAAYTLGGNLANPLGRYGRGALHLAALGGYQDTVEWLVAQGLDLNSRDREGSTPLMLACTKSLELAKWMVAHGAELQAVNDQQMNVLHMAMRDSSLEVVKWLVEGERMDLEARDDQKGLTAIGFAVLFANSPAVEYLAGRNASLVETDRRGMGLLHTAVFSGNTQVIEDLVNIHVDLEQRSTYEGWTPLIYAAFMGNNFVVEKLLELGADVNARDNGGMNALEINAVQPTGDSRQAVDQALRQAMQAAPAGAGAEGAPKLPSAAE